MTFRDEASMWICRNAKMTIGYPARQENNIAFNYRYTAFDLNRFRWFWITGDIRLGTSVAATVKDISAFSPGATLVLSISPRLAAITYESGIALYVYL
jgi:hypothetical protein